MTPAWMRQKTDAIEEQIKAWQDDGLRPIDAWSALGGSGVVMNVDWETVRRLQRRFYGIIEITPAAGREAGIARAEKRKKRVKKPCLRCGNTFGSEGFHNRLCDPCRREI